MQVLWTFSTVVALDMRFSLWIVNSSGPLFASRSAQFRPFERANARTKTDLLMTASEMDVCVSVRQKSRNSLDFSSLSWPNRGSQQRRQRNPFTMAERRYYYWVVLD